MNSLSRFRIFLAAALAVLTLSTAGAALAQATAPSPEPVAAAPAAPVISLPPATEVVSNPYGIEALWKQGDFIARGTLIILVIMSLGSWYIGRFD